MNKQLNSNLAASILIVTAIIVLLVIFPVSI